jgi:tRNA threonylcarbamoyladenosine biosynthesis protein TsaE
MSATRTWYAADVAATEALGAALAGTCGHGAAIYLCGELGAGKTTLVRGLLRALGHRGPVKSPTYTLVETYQLAGRTVHHLDLYRLSDPGELEYLGLRDFHEPETILLVEWPERGGADLAPADVVVEIDYAGDGRQVRLTAHSARGESLLAALSAPDQVRGES